MNERLIAGSQLAAAALSVVLMGMAGIELTVRLVRVAKGAERADGMAQRNAAHASWRQMALAASAALVSRLLVYLMAWVMLRLLGESGRILETLERLWLHWDTKHYVGIAGQGYTAVGEERLRLVFFPLFPLLMRAFSVFTSGNLFFAGMLVSLLCTMAAAALLFELGMMHGGEKTAMRCVGYFLLSPMSVFLNCAYTEALFIALTLGTVCLYRRGRPWLAALCGAASALTRMPGVIIAGLFIIGLIGDASERHLSVRSVLRCAAQVLIVFCGLFVYWGINWVVTGDPFTYLIYQKENWYQEAGSFWQTAQTTVYYVFSVIGESDWFFCWVTQLGAMFAMYALLAARNRKLPFDLAAYSFVYVAVVLSPTWLLSGPRYLYALCALPLLKAGISKKAWVHEVLMGISLALMPLYTFGYTLAIAVL